MQLQDLLATASSLPTLSLHQLVLFVRLAQVARPSIEISLLKAHSAPQNLPCDIRQLLSCAIKEGPDVVDQCWAATKEYLWALSPNSAQVQLHEDKISLFNEHALALNLSYRHQYPPTRVCLRHGCSNARPDGNPENARTLTNALTHQATLFTMREGTLPIYTTSTYCRGCYTRYYPNYFVHSQSGTRTYYAGIPNAIQVTQHCYMDCELLEFFASSSVHGWLSSMNCARIYNESMGQRHSNVLNNPGAYLGIFSRPKVPRIIVEQSRKLQDDQVLNGFFLYALLLEKEENETTLILSHHEPSQCARLKEALAERNSHMEGTGQEAYRHACDRCFIISANSEGQKVKIHPAVCDGVTVGHPCCAVHDCKEELINNRHRFCATHHSLNIKCAVTDCMDLHGDGFRTCSSPDHRALEQAYFRHGQGVFKLRDRLKKAGALLPSNSMSEEASNHDAEAVVEASLQSPISDASSITVVEDPDAVAECEGKADGGNKKLQAFFGRRRTHNEQLMMRPCGIIIARATFFGSEAVSAVNTFAKAVFPTPQSTPEFLVFDNNCKLDAHLKRINDEHFKDTAKPVDVFHFTSKHKITDTHCQCNCNPAAFPELIKDGKWQINMSICEQTNLWIGGFQAILRDMEAVRYNFYLDEMIKRRNRYIIKQLDIKGHTPWNIPVQTIFP